MFKSKQPKKSVFQSICSVCGTTCQTCLSVVSIPDARVAYRSALEYLTFVSSSKMVTLSPLPMVTAWIHWDPSVCLLLSISQGDVAKQGMSSQLAQLLPLQKINVSDPFLASWECGSLVYSIIQMRHLGRASSLSYAEKLKKLLFLVWSLLQC